MVINIEKLKKIFTVFLIIIVALLVMIALYTNRTRFYSPKVIRYDRITISVNNDINKVLEEYSLSSNKDKLVSEIKKANKLSSLNNESVFGKTIYVPVIK